MPLNVTQSQVLEIRTWTTWGEGIVLAIKVFLSPLISSASCLYNVDHFSMSNFYSETFTFYSETFTFTWKTGVGREWCPLVQGDKRGVPRCSVGKSLPARFDSWVRKISWRRKWQSTPIFLPGESQGQRSLAGSLWGCQCMGLQESDTPKHTQPQHKKILDVLSKAPFRVISAFPGL